MKKRINKQTNEQTNNIEKASKQESRPEKPFLSSVYVCVCAVQHHMCGSE